VKTWAAPAALFRERIALRRLDWRVTYYGMCALTGVAATATGYSADYMLVVYRNAAAATVLFFAIRALLWLLSERPERIAPVMAEAARFAVDRSALFLCSILFFIWLAPLKSLIPVAHGFFADPLLGRLDRMFLGTDAWRIAHFVPFVKPIDVLYTAWPLFMQVGALWIAVTADQAVLRRFFLGWAACFWLLGIGLAFALASAGPMFGPELAFGFNDLRFALAPAHYAMFAHDALWRIYANHAAEIGGGISAAPSMHCALTFLFVLAVRQTGLFVPALLYLGFIYFGSIYLGWHYASDGLISFAGVALIWRSLRTPVTVE
jgi:hypothetical protein